MARWSAATISVKSLEFYRETLDDLERTEADFFDASEEEADNLNQVNENIYVL